MQIDASPTVRQVWALAAALCARSGEAFPATRGEASELIERLRLEQGHPAPRLEDSPLRGCRSRRRRGTERFAHAIAVQVARELR